MNSEERSTLEANKREMFDAMRAYHESELAHKQDAISLLSTVLAAVGAIAVALVLPERPIPNASLLAGFTALAATLGVFVIVRTTNAKVQKDHERYAELGKEYVRTSEALGLYNAIPVGSTNTAIKASRDIGSGAGYKYTKRIILAVGVVIAILAWLAAGYVWFTERRPTQALALGRPASPSAR